MFLDHIFLIKIFSSVDSFYFLDCRKLGETDISSFSGTNEVQLSALIESLHEPWDAALTSNLSVCGLCQLVYLMTITVQPWTRIADLRVEFKYSKLLKRLTNAFNAVKQEQTHWNRVCAMIGSGVALLTEDSLNRCALQLGWQPTWMTETQNNTRRTIFPATGYGAMRASVRPVENNPEAAGIPVPQFRGAVYPGEVDEGVTSTTSPPPARIRRRAIFLLEQLFVQIREICFLQNPSMWKLQQMLLQMLVLL